MSIHKLTYTAPEDGRSAVLRISFTLPVQTIEMNFTHSADRVASDFLEKARKLRVDPAGATDYLLGLANILNKIAVVAEILKKEKNVRNGGYSEPPKVEESAPDPDENYSCGDTVELAIEEDLNKP